MYVGPYKSQPVGLFMQQGEMQLKVESTIQFGCASIAHCFYNLKYTYINKLK
jgi:hypothetical protein